jgi:hypothetical protein
MRSPCRTLPLYFHCHHGKQGIFRLASTRKGDQQRFGVFSVKFLFGIFLMFAEEFGVETDVAGFVDTMHISEACGDGEVRANFREVAVYIPNIFWLGV